MAYKVKMLAHDGLCLLTYSGKVTSADFEGVWRDVGAHKDYRPDIDDIVVLGPDADQSDFAHQMAADEAEKFAHVPGHDGPRGIKHTAVVCASDMQFVVSRMFGAYLMAYWPSLVRVESFRDLDAAIDWIEPANDDGRRLDREAIKAHLSEMGEGWCCRKASA
jgi:hypothetical protein